MMHSTDNYGSSGVPAFLHKLWTLVEDDSTNELISWDSSGQSFHVFDQSRFSKEVLPHYFKHSNIASFIRQLNMYGFRKVSSVEHGGLKIEKDDMEFSHPYFQRGQEHLLENIKRKVASSKSEDVRLKPDDVSKVLRDVHSMKGRQENITSKMDALERENEALWREVASMRQKHLKQQKIVNKLIQFLVTLVGNRGLGGGGGGGGVKRKMPLMINDIGQFTGAGGGPSAPKLARQYSVEGPSSAKNIQVIPKVESPLSVSVESPAQTGGVHIEEMVEPIEPPPRGALPQYTVINTANTAGLAPSPNPQQTYIIIKPNTATNATTAQGNTPQKSVGLAQPVSIMAPAQPPAPPQPPMAPQPPVAASPGLSQGYLPAGYDLQDILPSEVAVEEEVTDPVLGGQSSASPRKRGRAAGNTVALPDNKPSGSVLSDVNTQLSSMDSSLDDLREMLAGNVDLSALRLDTDTLQGLFTPEAPIPQTPETFFNLSEDGKPDFSSADNITGHELIQYNPPEDFGSLFDLGMDSPTGSDTNDIISQESVMEGLSTPQYEVTSPLARRRHSKNATITTDQLD